MNGQSNNAKQFRCNSFFIRLGDKAVFLVFTLVIISLLNACESIPNPNEPPVRLSGLSNQDTNQFAYIWTSGTTTEGSIGGDFYYASITKIDDINVPDEYLPEAGRAPSYSWLLEIPVGKHTAEILFKQSNFFMGASEKSRQTLTFMAKPYQEYYPFASVSCSREYFWIAHLVSNYYASADFQRKRTNYRQGTVHHINDVRVNMRNRWAIDHEVVAGERPNQKPC